MIERVTMTMDGQWGSTGKGKMAYYLAKRVRYGAAFTDNGPNAGHTIASKHGLPPGAACKSMVFQQLPVASAIPDILIFMGPGSIVDKELFFREVAMVGNAWRIAIHPTAAVIGPEDRESEQQSLQAISSTLKGTGMASARRNMRHPDAVACAHPDLREFTNRWHSQMEEFRNSELPALVESSQGHDLSISSHFYPYTTARDINPLAVLARCGFTTWPAHQVDVVGCLRLHPIRVGSLPGSSSGPFWPDQRELTWEELGVPQELTTVTHRVRRVFTWSGLQFASFVEKCRPTQLFLNFVQYSFPAIGDPTSLDRERMRTWIERNIKPYCDIKTFFIGFGASDEDIYTETV